MKQDDLYDVVIIGSGAGGGASAWALCQAGLKVLVLEAGPRFDPAKDYSLHQANWEQSNFPEPPSSHGRYTFSPLQPLDEKWQDLHSWSHLYGRYNKGTQRLVGEYHHVRGVGGSTLHFSGEAHRLHPEAMQMHSRFGVAADWPLSYSELEPFYAEAERLIGIAGPAQDRQRPRQTPYPLPPHPKSFASQRLAAGCEQLGLSWQANSLAILSQSYDKRPPCNYCGNCARGCPRTDKGSVDVTFMRKALATGRCTLLTGATVSKLVAGDDDSVKQVLFSDAEGRQQQAQGRLFIVACGAIETPRLLLNSHSVHAPDGLANESGQVGLNFMETLSWGMNALHPESLGSHRGVPADSICWDFNAPDAIPGVIGGCRFTPNMAEANLIGPINYARRVVPGWGRSHKQTMREQFGRVLSLGAIGECLPNTKSYIDLDPEAVDQHDQPLARIHSYLAKDALQRLRFMTEKGREILEASGVEKILEQVSSYDHFSSTHVFGTCQMGGAAEDSVVDVNGRSHRWQNLYVVDASVFPSSGGGESPSLTIQALALRTARQIRARLMQRDLA